MPPWLSAGWEPAGRHAEEPPEPVGQVGLVEEADLGGDVRQWLAVEDAIAGGLEATADDVGVRRDPERRLEAPGEMGRVAPRSSARRPS